MYTTNFRWSLNHFVGSIWSKLELIKWHNSVRRGFNTWGRSFMIIKNERGPRIEPWDTPESMLVSWRMVTYGCVLGSISQKSMYPWEYAWVKIKTREFKEKSLMNVIKSLWKIEEDYISLEQSGDLNEGSEWTRTVAIHRSDLGERHDGF